MKAVIFDQSDEVMHVDAVKEGRLILAKRGGEVAGMIIEEDKGFILRVDTSGGATGYHETIKECMESCLQYNYTFFVA